MKDQTPYVPWYHGDFLRSTAGWTLLERAAYWMLLCAEWESGPLPNEPQRLALIAGVYPDEFLVLWKHQISRKFNCLPDGRLVNERMEEHRANYLEYRQKLTEKSRKGAAARWKKDGKVIDFPKPEDRRE